MRTVLAVIVAMTFTIGMGSTVIAADEKKANPQQERTSAKP